jgi:hypothetical protein
VDIETDPLPDKAIVTPAGIFPEALGTASRFTGVFGWSLQVCVMVSFLYLALLFLARVVRKKRSRWSGRCGKTASRERIAFLSGPPQYLSLCWPYEILATDEPHPQWAETVKQFVAAAADLHWVTAYTTAPS